MLRSAHSTALEGDWGQLLAALIAPHSFCELHPKENRQVFCRTAGHWRSFHTPHANKAASSRNRPAALCAAPQPLPASRAQGMAEQQSSATSRAHTVSHPAPYPRTHTAMLAQLHTAVSLKAVPISLGATVHIQSTGSCYLIFSEGRGKGGIKEKKKENQKLRQTLLKIPEVGATAAGVNHRDAQCFLYMATKPFFCSNSYKMFPIKCFCSRCCSQLTFPAVLHPRAQPGPPSGSEQQPSTAGDKGPHRPRAALLQEPWEESK